MADIVANKEILPHFLNVSNVPDFHVFCEVRDRRACPQRAVPHETFKRTCFEKHAFQNLFFVHYALSEHFRGVFLEAKTLSPVGG